MPAAGRPLVPERSFDFVKPGGAERKEDGVFDFWRPVTARRTLTVSSRPPGRRGLKNPDEEKTESSISDDQSPFEETFGFFSSSRSDDLSEIKNLLSIGVHTIHHDKPRKE